MDVDGSTSGCEDGRKTPISGGQTDAGYLVKIVTRAQRVCGAGGDVGIRSLKNRCHL